VLDRERELKSTGAAATITPSIATGQ